MTYIGNTAPSRFSSVPAVQRFSGNNSTTAFTLSTAIGSEQEILVSVDGVIQDTANYTVSGTTLTFSPAPSAGTNNIFVFTLSRAIASVTHPPTSALSATSGTFSGNVSVGGDLDVTGSLDMSDANLTNVGSIQLDSIAGDADTNTTIAFPGSDVITLGTAGSERVRINASGNVGIGTNSPATALDVTGTVTADGLDIQGDGTISGGSRLTISDIADVNNDGFRLDDSTTARFNNLTQDSSGNFRIQHWTGSAWQNNFMVTTGGNVGIGGTNALVPSGTALEIYGASASRLKLSNSTTGTGATDGFQIYTTGSTAIIEQKENAEMRFYTNATEQLRLTSGGDLLINTTTDTSGGFSVQTIGNSTTGTRMLAHGFSVRNNWGSATNLGQGIFSPAGSTLAFSTASTERMRIDSAGRVGIGSAPDTGVKLTVNGSVGPTNGTASLPTHTFYSDPNTGIYRPGADNLGFAVGGQSKAFLSTTQFNITPPIVAQGGIKLGGNSVALDDYEEGTWTISYTGVTNTPSYHVLSNLYTKIGRLVTLTFNVQFNTAPTFSSSTAEFQVIGLPFAVQGTGGYINSTGAVRGQGFNFNGGTYNTESVSGQVVAVTQPTNNSLVFKVFDSGTSSGSVRNASGSAGGIIECIITYLTTA